MFSDSILELNGKTDVIWGHLFLFLKKLLCAYVRIWMEHPRAVFITSTVFIHYAIFHKLVSQLAAAWAHWIHQFSSEHWRATSCIMDCTWVVISKWGFLKRLKRPFLMIPLVFYLKTVDVMTALMSQEIFPHESEIFPSLSSLF